MSWSDLVQTDNRAYARRLMAQEKMTISDEATLTVDSNEDFSLPGQSVIYGADFEQLPPPGEFFTGKILLEGGTLHAIASKKKQTYAIWNYQTYSPEITIKNTNLIFDNYYMGVYFKNGILNISSDKGKGITLNDVDYGFALYGDSKVILQNLKTSFNNINYQGFYITDNANLNINEGIVAFSNKENTGKAYAVAGRSASIINFHNDKTIIDNFVCGFDLKGDSFLDISSQELSLSNVQNIFVADENSKANVFLEKVNSSDSEMFAAANQNAQISVESNDFDVNSDIVAAAFIDSKIDITANTIADIKGLLHADGNGSISEGDDKATINLNFNVNAENKYKSLTKNSAGSLNFTGDAIAVNKGKVNLNLGQGSYWEGRSDDFKDADSEEWRQEHGQEFGDVASDLQSSGRVNVTMSDGAYWNVTGQSWVSKLDGNGTIDLRGSETGGYAIHIGEITGSNTFLVNLDKDNKSQSDMIYVYNGSGAAEQNIVISNRDEVLDSMDVGERVRFATVANASGGFISDGMTTEFSGKKSISTFGRNTQIRDAGVKNVNFKIVYEPYNTDKATAEEDLGYNGGESFNDTKPGNEYVESIYSEGENPYNVYIERLMQSEGNDDISDIGKTVVDLSGYFAQSDPVKRSFYMFDSLG